MAIWDGSSINTNELNQLINQYWGMKSIPMVRRKNGFLYAILGKGEKGGNEPSGLKFSRFNKTSGANIQLNLLGSLKTIATVADGTAETTTWAGTVIPSNAFGGITLPLVHYADAEYFPDSEMDRYVGDENRTRGWIAERIDRLILSWENTLGNALNTTTAGNPGRTTICPWRHQISDGTSSGESGFATYGLNRSDAGNADFRGNVTVSVGDLTLPKIRTMINTTKTRGGQPSVGLAGTTVYGKVEQLVEAYTHVNYDESMSKFGGAYVRYAGMTYILEQRMGAALLGGIDPDSWALWLRDKPFSGSGIVQDPSRVATQVLNWGAWVGIYCNDPGRNFLMTGITS